MRNHFKHILILVLVLSFVLGIALSGCAFADIPPYEDEYKPISVRVNGKAVSDIAFTIKGNIYIKTSTLKKYGDTTKLTIDNNAKKVTFNSKDLNINLGSTEVSEFVKTYAGECFVPIKSFDDENSKTENFVAIGPIAQIAKLAWTYKNGMLLLSQYSEATNLATTGILSESAGSLKNSSIANLSNGEKVFIVKESNSFYKVETLDGDQYYVNKSEVTKVDDVNQLDDFDYIPTAKDTFDGPINLGWLPLAENATRTPLPPANSTGLDVLSPIWLHSPANQNGYVRQLCDYGYVQLAHQMGYKVWMCANNCFTETGTTKYTTALLADEKMSNRVIAQYLLYACMYEVDGSNLDYETLVNADKDNFTVFNQKLGKYCTDLGLTYSIAVYPYNQSNSNRYDFEKLGECSDYLAPMMYSSLESNVKPQSIADYQWYTNSTNGLASVCPPEKILLGTPLFTRYWYINEDQKVVDAENYKRYTGTISMLSVLDKIKDKEYTMTWDDSTKQNVLIYPSATGYNVKMWIEDERSMAYRLKYVMDAKLGGTACWALTQESEGMLDIFDAVFKQGVDPQTIIDKYELNQ
ncbi:MAG: glycosyl hydrolase family 18 protein [Clostridia bacterium]|nr:glycosyl hydrolase family 18 protein [Clostridia bacterium]